MAKLRKMRTWEAVLFSSPRRVARKLSRSFSVPSAESAVTPAILHQVRFEIGRHSASAIVSVPCVRAAEDESLFIKGIAATRDAGSTGGGQMSCVPTPAEAGAFGWRSCLASLFENIF